MSLICQLTSEDIKQHFTSWLLQCCFTSTETVRTIKDREPRTSTSTVTLLLISDSTAFFKCCFTSTETVRIIRDGEPGNGHLDFHTALKALFSAGFFCKECDTDRILSVSKTKSAPVVTAHIPKAADRECRSVNMVLKGQVQG